jgi:hypothetical protein
MTVIGDIFLGLIFVALCAVSYLLYVSKRESSDQFYIGLEDITRRLDDINGNLLIISGNASGIKNECAEFRREFAICFDNDLAKKIEAVLRTGEKPDNMVKKVNANGSIEYVPMDHGW